MAARSASPMRAADVGAGEIRALQYGRGIAALMVVLFHTEELIVHYFGGPASQHFFRVGASGVYFFFILSGFIIYHAHRNDLGRPARSAVFWKKRAIRLLPMFWLIVIPLGLIFLAVSSLGVDRALTPGAFLLDVLLVPRDGKLTLPPAWTLQHELVFYALFSLLIVNIRLGIAALVLWQVACVGVAISGIFPVDYRVPVNKLVGPFNFGFVFGLAIALLHERTGGLMRQRSAKLAGLFAALGIAAMAYVEINQRFPDIVGYLNGSQIIYLLIYFFLYSLCIVYLVFSQTKVPSGADKALALLGSASYTLYLLHEPLSSALIKILAMPLFRASAMPLVAFGVVVGATVVLSILVHLLVEKPIMGLLRQTFLAPRAAGGAIA